MMTAPVVALDPSACGDAPIAHKNGQSRTLLATLSGRHSYIAPASVAASVAAFRASGGVDAGVCSVGGVSTGVAGEPRGVWISD